MRLTAKAAPRQKRIMVTSKVLVTSLPKMKGNEVQNPWRSCFVLSVLLSKFASYVLSVLLSSMQSKPSSFDVLLLVFLSLV